MSRLYRVIAHPYRAAVIIIFIVQEVFNIWLASVPSALVGCAIGLSLILTLTCYWYPVVCSLLLIIFNGIGEYAINGYGEYTALFMYLALALYAYESTTRKTVILLGVMWVYTLVEGFLRPSAMQPKAVITFMFFYTLLVLLGCGLRWNDERNRQLREAMQAKHELQVLKNNQMIAANLHNVLAQRLAVISMIAQINGLDDTSDDDSWKQVEAYSQTALVDLRTVIHHLRENKAQVQQESLSLFLEDLHNEIHDGYVILKDQGFQGKTKVNVLPSTKLDSVQNSSIVLMVMKEIYTNILKHGSTAHPYGVEVNVEDPNITVRYHNAIAQRSENETLPGGNGLDSLDTIITSIGGTSSYDARNGVWHGSLSIPVTQQSEFTIMQ